MCYVEDPAIGGAEIAAGAIYEIGSKENNAEQAGFALEIVKLFEKEVLV